MPSLLTPCCHRFVNTENWRGEIKLDELVPVWEYPEKPEINKYYKQYYHKTDKVRFGNRGLCLASTAQRLKSP